MNHHYDCYRDAVGPWNDDDGRRTSGHPAGVPYYPAPAPVSPASPPAIRPQRPWTRHAIYAGLIVVANLIFHLYCQNWQLVDKCRGHHSMMLLAVVFAIVLLIKAMLYFNPDDLVPLIVALPSGAAGIFGIIALLADMPGLEGWVGHPSGAALLGDFELVFVPFATILQLVLVLRDYRTTRRAPMPRPAVSQHSCRSPRASGSALWSPVRSFRGDDDIPF